MQSKKWRNNRARKIYKRILIDTSLGYILLSHIPVSTKAMALKFTSQQSFFWKHTNILGHYLKGFSREIISYTTQLRPYGTRLVVASYVDQCVGFHLFSENGSNSDNRKVWKNPFSLLYFRGGKKTLKLQVVLTINLAMEYWQSHA